MRCKHCGPEFPLRIEYREELEAKPLVTFSLAGAQMKFSAIKREWPWAVCDNCQRESRGKAMKAIDRMNRADGEGWGCGQPGCKACY